LCKLIAPAVGDIDTPEAFLRSIGRGAEEKVDIGDWTQFWRTGGSELRAANVDVKDRKCVLHSILSLWEFGAYSSPYKVYHVGYGEIPAGP
jgi:hypothetical protein